MFPDPLLIYPDQVTSAGMTFVKTNSGANSSVFRAIHDANYPMGLWPTFLKMNQSVVGKGVTRRNRAQLRLDTLSYDETSGVGVYGTHAPTNVYLVWDGPQSYLPSGVTQQDLLSYSLRVMSGAFRTASGDTADTIDYSALTGRITNGEV